MEAEHQKAIASNSYFLTQNLDIDDSFLQYLFSKGVMIQQQMDQIRSKATSYEKAFLLKKTIVRRGPDAFPALIGALMVTGQQHVAERLSPALANEWREMNAKRLEKPRSLSADAAEDYIVRDEGDPDITVLLKPTPQHIVNTVFMDEEHHYRMTSRVRGRAVIVNIMEFKNSQDSKREGSDVDAANLKKLYTELGFTVDIWVDFTTKAIKESIAKLKNDWSQLIERAGDAFIFIILSHGDVDVIHTYDGDINMESDIIRAFTTDCYALKGKPKIFIIQACRGGKETDRPTDPGDGDDWVESAKSRYKPMEKENITDCLVMYSTVKGYRSYRNTETGSSFVRELIHSFMQSCHKDDIDSLITQVTFRMNERRDRRNMKADKATASEQSNISYANQICSKQSGFKKKLYFLPGYDFLS